MSLRGGTYIVTGGAGAIGSAVAAAIASRGGTIVVVCDIASDRAQVIADRIGGTAIQLDIADPSRSMCWSGGFVATGRRSPALSTAPPSSANPLSIQRTGKRGGER